jgi:hypothetical protein
VEHILLAANVLEAAAFGVDLAENSSDAAVQIAGDSVAYACTMNVHVLMLRPIATGLVHAAGNRWQLMHSDSFASADCERVRLSHSQDPKMQTNNHLEDRSPATSQNEIQMLQRSEELA